MYGGMSCHSLQAMMKAYMQGDHLLEGRKNSRRGELADSVQNRRSIGGAVWQVSSHSSEEVNWLRLLEDAFNVDCYLAQPL